MTIARGECFMFYMSFPTSSQRCEKRHRSARFENEMRAANVIPAAASPLDSSAFMNRNDLLASVSFYPSVRPSIGRSVSLMLFLLRLGISPRSLSCGRSVIQTQPCVSLCVNPRRLYHVLAADSEASNVTVRTSKQAEFNVSLDT